MVIKYVLVIALFIGLLTGSYYRGASDKELEMQSAYDKAFYEQQSKYIAQQKEWQNKLDSLDSAHAEEMLDVQENINSMLNNVRVERVFVRTKTKTSCPVSRDTTGESGSSEQDSRAELHPEVVENLIGLTRECDALVVDFNYLKNYVKSLRD